MLVVSKLLGVTASLGLIYLFVTRRLTGEEIAFIALVAFGALIQMLPAIIARRRRHRDVLPLTVLSAVLTLMLGTVAIAIWADKPLFFSPGHIAGGWLVAFVWSLMPVRKHGLDLLAEFDHYEKQIRKMITFAFGLGFMVTPKARRRGKVVWPQRPQLAKRAPATRS